ncbi:hypothetical protein PAHAL_5G478700 [Panicum hallii]|jgi:hypothetical protein|uniref:Receptor-like serine/threonine-protein kinase n=1 Tax=Panicum hallii TaxID=206008 RepID=A0A2S3HXW3_9POAL|nr:G-type lectin S-receptor-like serine/threonine-protein kinase At2g19130 [Panicum hallii]PAN32328.1 hypothetical protein PAHAL_5G478700 [Panicum hallii]
MSASATLRTLVVGLLALLGACRSAAATDTISPGRALAGGGGGRILSNNSKFTLGFFRAPDGSADSSPGATAPPDKWYLGVWFTAVPRLTTVWVANGANPVVDADADAASPELTVSGGGDLVVVNQATRSVTWSARSAHDTAKNATSTTVAVLLNSGNLVLLDASNSSAPRTLWQSFDHPTDTLLPGAKLGRDKATGVNRRLVSRKSAATPSPGPYCFEVDPDAPQLVVKLCDSPVAYWATGAWNGRYFRNIPELAGNVPSFHLAFVDDAREEYLQFNVTAEATVTRNIVDVTGQNKHQVWIDASQDWLTLYAGPKAPCDVYAACGPFTVCSYAGLQPCSCMKGFSVRSPMDWEQGDRTGGCVRDATLDCTPGNSTSSAASSTDGFFSMPGIGLPDRGRGLQNVRSSAECSTACLKNCSCTAYSYASQGCLVWLDRLINAKQSQSNATNTVSDEEILYLRLAAREFQTSGSKNRVIIIGVVTGACTVALILLVLFIVLMTRRKKAKNNIQGGDGARLVAFSYRELRSATDNFSEKLGQGGFGSVFMGQLRDSTAIAAKRLDSSLQGEKQFRAEMSSIGIIQHINLVKLVGFCCEGENRFLVYEHMPNRSLDIHLFQSTGGTGGVFLDWAARYQIAVGVARGLSYLHDGCRDRIIHCDVKPENILLDASLLPKLADFGMAKFVGRGFSRVLTTMRGTKGYLAPEWIGGAAITPKVDVYSYGMVLLELVSGRRNTSGAGEECRSTASDGGHRLVYFPMKAARELIEGDVGTLLDERLRGDANLEEVERACKVACWCIQDDEADRPAMGEVVQILEGVMDRGMPPLPRLLEAILGRPHSSTQQMTTVSNASATFTSGSGS